MSARRRVAARGLREYAAGLLKQNSELRAQAETLCEQSRGLVTQSEKYRAGAPIASRMGWRPRTSS